MKKWLSQSIEKDAYPFVVATYAEKIGWVSAEAADGMAALLAESTASQDLLERMSRRRGWDENKARSRYIVERQPTSDILRKGKFGEVLHGAILEEFCGMTVICHRYRYSPSPNISPPGLDIIALMPQADGDGERIVFVETKLRLNADARTLVNALAQLAKEQGVSEPQSLKSTLQVLSAADPRLYERVLQAVGSEAHKPHYRIGAVVEAKSWSNASLRQLKSIPDRMQDMCFAVDVVKINALGDLIKESYVRVRRSIV